MVNTLTNYRQRLGQMAGFHWYGSTSSAGASDGSTIVANTWQSTELEDTHLKDAWYYVPSTLEARRIREHGLQPSTGTISPDRSHAAQIGNAVNVEIYGKLPPVGMEGRIGLNTLVNRALSECWTLQKFAIAGVTNQRQYGLSPTFPFVQTEDQIAEVYYRPQNSDVNDDDLLMPRWRFVPGGDSPFVEIGMPISTGDTLKLMLFVPLSWWLFQNSAWGLAASEGLQAESDGALLDLEGFEIVASWYLYQEMAKWGEQSDQDKYRELALQARKAANIWKLTSMHYFDAYREDHWAPVIVVATQTTTYDVVPLSRG